VIRSRAAAERLSITPAPVPSPTNTSPPGGAATLPDRDWAARLGEARARTLALVEGLDGERLERQHHALMSPLCWDLAHIAAYEDLWLCHRTGGLELLRPDLAHVYDAFETPRAVRGSAPLLTAAGAREYLDAVRERTLAVLEALEPSPEDTRPEGSGFVWEMVLQHEMQHGETMLQALKLAPAGFHSPPRRPLAGAGPPAPAGIALAIDAAAFELGAPAEGFAYDNERTAHAVAVGPLRIDRTPVTNGAYAEFVADGGYARPELWTPEGWEWRARERIERPLYWTVDGGERDFERTAERDPDLPVMHVSWYEADAFARWRGARLPTEAEWELAATWDAAAGRKLAQPWGEAPATPAQANLDQLAYGPAPAGAYPAGAAPSGALGMVGDCWEWTASEFRGYPGFRAFPYREYSEVFFGERYRVLRGGSWATRAHVARPTFRNWDLPQRRQIFAGFRCAEDV
jgi:gamma-glutamyl hercynylcysteine S-oxide synthase